MPLTREERKLLHQKSKQPTFGINKPDPLEGNEGDVSYRRIEGSGTVQYLKQGGEWIAMSSSGSMPPSRNIIKSSSSGSSSSRQHGLLTGLGSDSHTQYLLVSGTRAMTGNLDMGTNNIGSVGTLDVDGHTTLDQVTINTTDGAFAVSGGNPISLTTTGSNDINITTAQTLDVDINEDYEMYVRDLCDWDTSTVDWDNASTFTLTSVDNLTIETSGATTAKTILLFNDNNHASAFRGIHLKTDAQDASSSQNSILIECTNRNSKGGGIGVDISSADGVLIRGEDANNGDESGVQIRATESIDLAGGSNNITPTTGNPKRTKIHDTTEIEKLYRPTGSKILTNLDTITSGNESGHTEFESINTYHLVRAMTIRTSTTSAFETDTTCQVTNGSSTITHSSNSQIFKGMKVTGPSGYIPANTFVGGTVTSTEFTLVNTVGNPVNASDGDGSAVSLDFFNESTIENGNSIGIVHKNDDDRAIGTAWMVTVTWGVGSTGYAQVWYAVHQYNDDPVIFLTGEGINGASSGGVSGVGDATGTLEWDSSYGIKWTNNSGSADAVSVKCSALKIQSGTNDF